MHDTGVDQARLFEAGDDLDRVAEGCAGALQEPALALRASQRIGADDPHAVRVHGAKPLPEALEAAQRALLGLIVQQAVRA